MTAADVPPAAGTGTSHGEFTAEVDLAAPVEQVWASLVDGPRRSRWLRIPGRTDPVPPVDYAAGVGETLRAQATVDGATQHLERTTHVVEVVPHRHLVLTYRVVVDAEPRWVSLVTVTLHPAGDEPTRLRWLEQYTFLRPPGPDDVPHLIGGTRLLLTALAVELGVTPQPARVRTPHR